MVQCLDSEASCVVNRLREPMLQDNQSSSLQVPARPVYPPSPLKQCPLEVLLYCRAKDLVMACHLQLLDFSGGGVLLDLREVWVCASSIA